MTKIGILALALLAALQALADDGASCARANRIDFGIDQLKESLGFVMVCDPTANFSAYGKPCISASILSDQQLKEAFDLVAKVKEIPYDYPEDGCYARAMEMARLLETEGILSVKAIINVPYALGVDSKGKSILIPKNLNKMLHVDTKNSPKGYVEWVWHIAPVVYRRDGDKLVPMVIDPSLFDHAVTADEWTRAMVSREHPDYQLNYSTRFKFSILEKMDDCAQKDYVEDDLAYMRDELREFSEIARKRKRASFWSEVWGGQ